MKKRNLIRFSFVALGVAALAISCNDDEFLDRKPLGNATEGDIAAGGFEEKAFGLYGQLRTEGGVSDWTRYWFQSIRSDDAAKGSTSGDAASFGTIFDSFQYSAAEAFAGSNWVGHYKIIFAANDLIGGVDDLGADADEGSIVNKAEATALRAFCFFELRRDYGEVPINLRRIVTPEDEIMAKSTVAEVDAQIVTDLTFAIEHLPTSWPAYPGRATKGFAQTLLGKLYLYQGNYTQALAQFQEVMGYGYGLHSSYADLFLQTGDNSAESVFEIQFLRLAGVNYSNNYWESQGVRGTSTWDLGWGFNVPTQGLVDAYETGDPRKEATILYSGGTDGYGLTVPQSPPLAQPYWNRKAYTRPAERTDYGENKNHWANIKIIRYADVLLMAAEAANEAGQTATALDYLNQVRARARAGNNSVLPDITSGDQATVRAAIKHERRIELAMEGERFYDLVRWGDATSVLGGLGYQNKNRYYPIPQTAIDQSGGVLVQNPDY